jgi:hypothetical protein
LVHPAEPYEVAISTGGKALVFLPHEFVPAMIQGSAISEWCLSPEDIAGGQGLAGVLREWATHPDVELDGDLSEVLVLGMHADGVQYNASIRAGGGRSLVVGSMNIVSAADPKRKHRRQPLFVLKKGRLCKCSCLGFHTLQELMEVVAWSMGCLARGETPTCRHDGSPWSRLDQQTRVPGGQIIPKAALLQVRGDWEFLEQCFRLRSVHSDEFCWMCDATSKTMGPRHFHDFRPEAGHRQSLVSNQEYLQRCFREARQPSHLFRCPGFKIDFLTVDSMHAADLGTFQDAMGSLLWIECTHKDFYPNKKAGLARLNADLNMFYAAHQDRGFSKITPLTEGQLFGKDPGYPYLKAKAAQTRQLSGFCLTLARLHRAGGPNRPAFRFRQNHRLSAHSELHCDLLVALFEGLHGYTSACAEDIFDPDKCRQSMYQYLQSLKSLHDLWRQGVPQDEWKPLPWHIRPKAHACQHLVHEKIELWGNPSKFWCYADEDFVGAVKYIARKTSLPITMEQRVCEKLRILSAMSN